MRRFLPFIRTTLFFFMSVLSVSAGADDLTISDTWPPAIDPPKLKIVLEGKAYLKKSIVVGMSDAGRREIAPIAGGFFKGDGINATSQINGADWQLVRQDGVWELFAHYSIVTDDGITIIVENRGIAVERIDENGKPLPEYIRTTPTFHAPVGKYDWLNKSIFVGTVTPGPNMEYVIVRIFEVL